MKRVLGIAMMADGVLQAMGVAGVVSTLWDRSLQDQILAAGHVAVGAALLWTGRSFSAGDRATPGANASARVPIAALLAALLLSVSEATWFNWIDAVMRACYTAVALVIVLRRTNLPTT